MADWANFYVIVGSAAAALIGMQFVVITLVANMRERPAPDTLNAFGTPTVVHLTSALIVAAIMSAPWHSLPLASVALMLCGVAGVAYGAIVIRRARRQSFYEPVWQDWLWYLALPWAVYLTLAIAAAAALRTSAQVDLFIVAAAALALLLIGIHNAWDTVTHVVLTQSSGDST